MTARIDPQHKDASAHRAVLNILVVEDEDVLRFCIKEILTQGGHTVETAANGVEGLEKFQIKRFDAVFSDYSMPKMNGAQLAEHIKVISSQTPFIMVTAYATLLGKNVAKTENVDRVLSKPFHPNELLDALNQS